MLKGLTVLGSVILIVFVYFVFNNLTDNKDNTNNTQKMKSTSPYSTINSDISKQQLRSWNSKWTNGKARYLKSGQVDPYDAEFVARGNGTIYINGQGIAFMQGDSPRMYIYDQEKKLKWNNVEVTIYAKRVSELELKSSQGFVIGARSEHQDASSQKPCLGRAYYGRLLYDGRAVFQKELMHDNVYSINQPSEKNYVKWDTKDGTIPRNIWIGIKFKVFTNPDGKSVTLQLYRDLSGGKGGGNWEKVAEYVDNGNWSITDSNIDLQAKCGYPSNLPLINPGTSIFIRNDMVEVAQYKNISIKEINE